MQSHQQPPAPLSRAGRAAADAVTNVGRLAATVERLREEIRRAQRAAEGRALIEVAKGILIERLQCGPTAAAQQLATLAEQADLTQLELAADIINQAARDRISQTARDFLDATRSGRSPREVADVAVRLRSAEIGMLTATESQAVAQSLLEHALAPLGATGVAIWSAGSDASLTLVGHAGFSAAEARQWRYVPPGVATPAQRALVERESLWTRALSDVGLPSIGMREAPDGGRVAVPAGTGGRIVGVLEIGWPAPLEPQPPQVIRQVEALADLCAHTLELPAGSGDTLGLAELTDLADALPDAALVLTPHLDGDGNLADFRISHINPRFVDPAGRPAGAVSGALMLEAYPLAADEGGLFSMIERVHATGEAFIADQMTITALVDQVPLDNIATVSVTRHGAGVLLIWRLQDESARLASLLQHAQRLGRIGAFEEDALTGEITWSSQLYTLHGLEPSQPPIPLEQLADYAHPDDANAIGRFLRKLLHHRLPDSTTFRLQRPDGIARHIRVVADPVLAPDGRLLAIRGAFQDISSQHWTEVALAATRDQLAHSEQQAAERNRLALHVTATAICALYDPQTRVLRWARAGHLPPILIRRDEAVEMDMIGGVLLGAVSEADYDEGQVQLEQGDIILMYTDGLIERRDRDLHHSQEQLLRTAMRHTSTLEHRLDHLLTHSNSDTDDDTCLVGIQLR